VEEAAAVVGPLMQKKHLEFGIDIPAGMPVVNCDRVRIRQVLLNLLSNAARFTDAGSIRVAVKHQADRALVSVTDTGPGMSAEEAEGVFEPFCQGGGSIWRDKGGSGLGLSISKELIELHGGRIWFDTALGEGTTFSFALPIAPPPPHPARPGHQIIGEWEWVDRPSGPDIAESVIKRRVVLCDETGALGQSFARVATEEITLAETRELQEAIAEVNHLPAHAFIVNSTTLDRARALVRRASRQTQRAPVFGCSIPAPLRQAREAGATDYLVKPVTRGQLQRAIRTLGRPVRSILVVDDDPDVLQLLTRMLTAIDPALHAETAASGAQAMRALRASPPDLILLDVVLPDFDGWEVLRRMNEDEALHSIPVFMLSAQDPTNRPLSTESLLVAVGGGLPISRVVGCSLRVSQYLLQPEPAPGPALG
jgi:CheY-like chemotaxis protein